jgi:hypothetical protein
MRLTLAVFAAVLCAAAQADAVCCQGEVQTNQCYSGGKLNGPKWLNQVTLWVPSNACGQDTKQVNKTDQQCKKIGADARARADKAKAACAAKGGTVSVIGGQKANAAPDRPATDAPVKKGNKALPKALNKQ